jgi:hypothetical protein
MVKPKVENETKEQKFKRIATSRTLRILDNLRLLGNCANRNTYSYGKRDVGKIFSAIEKELKRVKALFNESNVEFSLD